jgi:hypothetical protein
VVVTCRVSLEADKNAFSGFDVFRNLEFNPEQVTDYTPLVCRDGGCRDGGEFKGGVNTVAKFPSQGVDSESLAVVDVVSNFADWRRFAPDAGGVIRAVCGLGVSPEGG